MITTPRPARAALPRLSYPRPTRPGGAALLTILAGCQEGAEGARWDLWKTPRLSPGCHGRVRFGDSDPAVRRHHGGRAGAALVHLAGARARRRGAGAGARRGPAARREDGHGPGDGRAH